MHIHTPKPRLLPLFSLLLLSGLLFFSSCAGEESSPQAETTNQGITSTTTPESPGETNSPVSAPDSEAEPETTGEMPSSADLPESTYGVIPRPPSEETETQEESPNELPNESTSEIPAKIPEPEPSEPTETLPQAKKFDIHQHLTWNDLLKKNVSSTGKVNYRGFKANQSELNQYLDELRAHPPKSDWSRNQKLAYWINVYNAFTVDLVVRHYPVKSIMDIGSPWDIKFVDIGGKTYSLSQIENSVIRPTFKEPRVHFALNCASKSCPKLLNKAYTAGNLNSLLSSQTRKYLADSRENTLDPKKSEISQIFEWYAEDFLQKGTLVEFLNKYSSAELTEKTKITFRQYDWSLNE